MKRERPTIRISFALPYIFIIWLLIIIATAAIGMTTGGNIYGTSNLMRLVMPIASVLGILASIITMIVSGVRMSERQGEEKRKPRKHFFASLVSLLLIVLFSVVILFLSSSLGIGIGGEINASQQPTIVFDDYSSAFTTSGRVYNLLDTPNKNINDSREFIKISYSGTITSRNVKDTIENSMDIIRSQGGRIDSFNNNEKNGNISFILPKYSFENFRKDIAELAHPKLYVENISGQNMLDKKVALEQEELQAIQDLVGLLDSQDYLKQTSAARITQLDREISSAQKRISLLREVIAMNADNGNHTTLQSYIGQYEGQVASLRQARNQEQANLNQENTRLEGEIDGTQGNLASVADREEALIQDVETVQGTLRVIHQSTWKIAGLVWPIRPGWALVIALLMSKMILWRMKLLPKIEFV